MRWLRSEWSFLLALAAGLVLRVYQITGQILGDDEWHALHALVTRGYASVLSHFGTSDYCIPLTVFYKAMADTVGLSELVMRAPMLLVGLVALVVLPLLVRHHAGPAAGGAFAWLLAISPLHIYFSRYARPYGITIFLAFVGVMAFYRWWSGGSRGWARLYAACAIAGPYFHLAVLPALAAPLLFALTDRFVSRGAGRPRSLADLVRVGVAVGLGLLVLLAPPVLVDARSLAVKAGRADVTWATLVGVARLFAGTVHGWLIVAAAVVSVVGGLALRSTGLPGYLAFVGLYQVAVILLLEPDSIAIPMVLARYSSALLPIVLLLVATGLATVEARLARALGRNPGGILAVGMSAVLLYFGPLKDIYYRPNDWTNHALFQYQYEPDNRYSRSLRPVRMPPFYRQLGALPRESLLIVEAPWYYEWPNIHYPYYQQVHRQHMKVGFVTAADRFARFGELPVGREGLRFRNFVHVADDRTLRADGVAYVVFHKDLRSEFPARRGRDAIEVASWLRIYTERYGRPVYEDEQIAAFDVRLGSRQ